MNTRRRLVLTGLVLGLGAGVVPARGEDVRAHTRETPHTVILDNQDVRPSTTTMGAGDALVFENYSGHTVRITFTEPADLKERIRCGLVKEKEAEKARAPWQLFAWSDGKLVGTIPPGRFASVCSFREGTYTFVTERIGVEARPAGGGGLPAKGQVIVK
jgi:hypothetical protein